MWGRGRGEGVVPQARSPTRGCTPSPLPSPPKGARGTGDLAMLSEAGLGVALHAKPHVQEGSLVRINHGDLTALLYLQGYAKGQFVR